MESSRTTLLRSKLLVEDGFDPVNMDITFVVEFLADWPADGVLDVGQSETMVVRALDVEDRLIDLYAKVVNYEEVAKEETEAAYSRAFIASKEATQKAKEQEAQCDVAYLAEVRKAAAAKAALRWLDKKIGTVSKRHYHCKEVLRAHGKLMPSGEDRHRFRGRGGKEEETRGIGEEGKGVFE